MVTKLVILGKKKSKRAKKDNKRKICFHRQCTGNKSDSCEVTKSDRMMIENAKNHSISSEHINALRGLIVVIKLRNCFNVKFKTKWQVQVQAKSTSGKFNLVTLGLEFVSCT